MSMKSQETIQTVISNTEQTLLLAEEFGVLDDNNRQRLTIIIDTLRRVIDEASLS